MKTKSIVLLMAFVLVVVLACLNAVSPGAAAPNVSIITLLPQITLFPMYTPVNVPDPALKQALHAKTGVPISEGLTVFDLASINGTLDLTGKGISNPEGLQYCTNVTDLLLADNKLTMLPERFEKLTKLKRIVLERNRFAEFPAALLLMPGLQEIRLASNEIGSLPANIDSITELLTLDVSKNKLTSLPASLWKLSKLKILSCSNNKIEQLPKELFKAPKLETLDAGFNRLTSVPTEVKNAPKLKALGLQYNAISKLPAGIGNAPNLQFLVASYNALSSVESSLYMGNITHLALAGNRITALPKDMEGEAFQLLNVEWNFMDVAPGSSDKAILDSMSVDSMSYMNQLSRVNITSSSSTEDTIMLKWKPLSDGSSGTTSWKVLKFDVYDATESAAKLLYTLDESSTGITLGGLEPNKEYNLFVRVYYELDVSGMKNQTSCDTHIKVTTKAASGAETTAPATTVEPSEEPAAAVEETAVAEETAQPAETPSAAPAAANAQGGGKTALLIALIVVGGIVALALVVLIAVLLRRPRTVRIRR